MFRADTAFTRPRFGFHCTWKPAEDKPAERSVEQGSCSRGCGIRTSLVRRTVIQGWISWGKCAFWWLNKGMLSCVGYFVCVRIVLFCCCFLFCFIYLNNCCYWLIASGCQGWSEHYGTSLSSRLVAVTSEHVLSSATCSLGSHLHRHRDFSGFTILQRSHHSNWIFPCWWSALSLLLLTGLWCFGCFQELN